MATAAATPTATAMASLSVAAAAAATATASTTERAATAAATGMAGEAAAGARQALLATREPWSFPLGRSEAVLQLLCQSISWLHLGWAMLGAGAAML